MEKKGKEASLMLGSNARSHFPESDLPARETEMRDDESSIRSVSQDAF